MIQQAELVDLVAVEYLRVSHDRSGRERSNNEQQNDNRGAWPFQFGKVYRDTGSASEYAQKTRDDFDDLIADIEHGRFGAQVLVLWENSRGSRRVGEWVELIDLCKLHGIRIAITTHHRVYDPANPRDRRSLIDDANDAEFESAKISERITRAVRQGAGHGRPHGRIPYGYRSVYDPDTGRLLRREPKPTEAAVVLEVYERIAQGHSLHAIAKDLASRAVERKDGQSFTPTGLRELVHADLYRGKRAHRPGGRRNGVTRAQYDREKQVVDGMWPAIVPEPLWLQVKRILTNPARKTTRPGRGKHLASFRTYCDACDSPLSATYNSDQRYYRCHKKGCVRISADELDTYIDGVVVGYLSRPDIAERMVAPDSADADLEAVSLQVAEIRVELDDLYDNVARGPGNGGVTASMAARAEPGIVARLKAAEALEQQLSTPSILRGLIDPGADVAQRWKSAELSTRREIIRILLAPTMIGQLRVKPILKVGWRTSAEARVVFKTG